MRFDNVNKKQKTSFDMELIRFVQLCSELLENIDSLNKYRDSVRTNEDYYKFKKELINIRNRAIIEAYDRECLQWKIINE